MGLSHQEQKDRARAEAQHHLEHSAVDRMRESNMVSDMKDSTVPNKPMDSMNNRGGGY